MISSLHISNYALISQIDIEFADGFNIITGETGAGKSIIIGALGLLLGERADSRSIRYSERKSVIEAEFIITDATASTVNPILSENDIDACDKSIILRRELLAGGRSRAFINDTPVKLTVLRQVALNLFDIHSQHQNLQLADGSYQTAIIDSIADNADLLSQYTRVYSEYRNLLRQYTDTRDMIRRNKADADFVAFQLDELREFAPQPGEHDELERERIMLANASNVGSHLSEAISALTEAITACRRGAAQCGRLAEYIDSATVLSQRIDSAAIELNDVLESLSSIDAAADPARLEDVESRLSSLYSLEIKHHVDTADALLELQHKLERQMTTLNDSDNILAELEARARKLKKDAVGVAQQITARRTDAANAFATVLRDKASQLGMPNLRCDITITPTKLGATGADSIDFRFAFNKNQAPASLSDVGSGGEISRLMLAIKSITAERMQLPSIIFDEIDTGVSGEIALRMGDMMGDIGRRMQVITITHLPSIAARGTRHFKVYKLDDDTSTNTCIRRLTDDERTAEIAVMLSGNSSDNAAIAAARSLIESAQTKQHD